MAKKRRSASKTATVYDQASKRLSAAHQAPLSILRREIGEALSKRGALVRLDRRNLVNGALYAIRAWYPIGSGPRDFRGRGRPSLSTNMTLLLTALHLAYWSASGGAGPPAYVRPASDGYRGKSPFAQYVAAVLGTVGVKQDVFSLIRAFERQMRYLRKAALKKYGTEKCYIMSQGAEVQVAHTDADRDALVNRGFAPYGI